MIEFNDNPPEITLTPQSLSYFMRNGYELKLVNKKFIRATATQSRILIPIIPVSGVTLRKDYNFERDGEWYKHAEEAGCIKFDFSVGCDLLCEFRATSGCLLQIPEVYAFVMSFCDMDAFYLKCRERLREFSSEGLANEFSKLTRNPTNISGRNVHVGAMLRVIDLIEHDTLRDARRAFLECADLSKDGIRQFCIDSGRCLNVRKKQDKED